ncbi:class I SAM-dependent RNA methyltransferase [uncultured Rubinisphaera sp.]|uniref:THUMP domain-containing class I SAM-dependent RNA methyltransferase n=1 Tax=uncultured Rubinisphaera sp. TaxID=1678686 RepID=UPI0030DCC7CD
MEQVTLSATCGFGLEAVVARELFKLGYPDVKKTDGRVTFTAPIDAIPKCNLHLRSANRVLLKLAEFPAEDFDAFFDQIRDLEWEGWIPRDAYIPVTGSSQKSKLHGVPALQGMAKKAIATRLQDVYKSELPESGASFPVHFDMRHDQCSLFLNTSGDGLHRRGYREKAGVAPLRETLAASLIQLSVWNRERTLLDPLCGSGTIPIEAALIARNIPPGRNRSFAAELWPRIPGQLWDEVRESAEAAIDTSEMLPIIATDQDYHVLKVARENARLAGVEEDIHFQQQDLSETTTKRKYGCLITNPPYGQRLNEEEEARQVWQTLSDVTEHWSTWSLFIFVASREFESLFGKRATRRRKLFNGSIECTYYQYLGDKPPSMRKRVISDEPSQAE